MLFMDRDLLSKETLQGRAFRFSHSVVFGRRHFAGFHPFQATDPEVHALGIRRAMKIVKAELAFRLWPGMAL
jgi:hypothetical protein